MKKTELCIFDLDGTLADSVQSIAKAANTALEGVGLKSNPVDDYKIFAGDGSKIMLQRSLKAAGDEKLALFDKAFEILEKSYAEFANYEVKDFPNLKKTLDVLKQKGIKIAVLTNKPHARAVNVVETLYGKDYFDYILGQRDDYNHKPSPEGAFIIAKYFGTVPQNCIYIGDTNTDMQTGKSAGMFTIGVTWGFRTKEELIKNNADAIIDDPLELFEYI